MFIQLSSQCCSGDAQARFDGCVDVVTGRRPASGGFVLQDITTGWFVAEGLFLTADPSRALRFDSPASARAFAERFACWRGLRVLLDTWIAELSAV